MGALSTLRSFRREAEETAEVVSGLVAKAQGELAKLSSSAEEAGSSVRETTSSIRTDLAGTEGAVASLTAAVRSGGSEARAEARRTRDVVEEEVEGAKQRTADQLDDLRERLSDARNQWAEEVKLALEAVEAGALGIEEFLSTWGDAVFQIGDDSVRIRELLSGLDLRKRGEEIRELIQGFREGAVELQGVLDFLAKSQFEIAQQLSDAVEKLRDGKITLERLREIVEQIQALFPDTEFADLAEALLQGAMEGRI